MLTTPNADGVYVIDANTRTANPRREPTHNRPGGPGFIEVHEILENENVRIERRLFKEQHVDQLCLTTFNVPDNVNVFAAAPSAGPLSTLSVQINQSRYEITLNWQSQTLVLDTQGGNDRIHIEDNVIVPVFVYTGEGDDRVFNAARIASVYTGPGDDFIAVLNGKCHVEAGDGNDEVHGYQGTHMTVYGGPGSDDISGGDGSCFIDGGEGDDHILGGRGPNILSGGPGNDRIKAGPASNVIYTGDGLNEVTQLKADDVTYFNFKSNLTVNCALMMHPDTLPDLPQGQLASHAIHLEPKPLAHSGITIQGSAPFIARVNDDLRLLLGSPTGQRLLAELERATLASGRPITIHEFYPEPNGLFAPDPASANWPFIHNNQPGRPSYGGSIWYNTTDIIPGTPSIINLFHELCHAYNNISGTVLRGESLDGIDGTKPRDLVPNSELQAVGLPTTAQPFDFDRDPSTPPTNTNPPAFSENGLRKELGLPPRLQYRKD
ncbi:M91 family zinc metallopeptidase [Pseudomonas antarctica]|uniref:M91 family zinc metallopeptidase n=1 Tax=Pseudomonas antarctica TaxID=219572 RepID=UPI003F7517AF